MTLNILISCMHQDKSIIERSNVQSDVVVINQCNEDKREEFKFVNKKGRDEILVNAKLVAVENHSLIGNAKKFQDILKSV